MTNLHLHRRVSRALFGAFLLLGLVPATVGAHSELDVAMPADGATVEGTPTDVSGTFTQDVDPDGSSIQLRDAAGALLGDGTVVPSDPRRMAIDPVPELTPGIYEVRWTTFSAEDGEGPERGTWTFTVTAAPTPSPTPTAAPTSAPTATPVSSPTATAPPTPAPSAVPSPSGDGGPTGGAGGEVLLPIVLGLALVAVAGFLFIGRRRPSGPA